VTPPRLTWLLVLCALVLLAIALTSCSTPPVVVTKTETVQVSVPGPAQKVPAALSADCPPDPLTGTTLGAILARLSSVETALARCRIQLGQIRALK
jgi:hypothetical protein